MTSISTHKLEQLKWQLSDLNEKIKEEEEDLRRKKKMTEINQLEVLIEPLTDYLNPLRSQLKNLYKKNRGLNKIGMWSEQFNLLNNEEIFVTLMSILKKQDERIEWLEEEAKKFSKFFKIQKVKEV